jgi:hypothetical protein
LPSACLHRLRRLFGWDDHSKRRETRAPRPAKDNYGSDLQEGPVDGSRPSPYFVWMDLMTNVVGPKRREKDDGELRIERARVERCEQFR